MLTGIGSRNDGVKQLSLMRDGEENPLRVPEREFCRRHGSEKSEEREVTRMLDTKNTEK